MKWYVVFVTLLAIALSHPLDQDVSQEDSEELEYFDQDVSEEDSEELEYFLYEGEDGNIYTEPLVGQPENLTASAKDVTYHFYSKSNPDKSVEIHSDNVKALSKTAFDVKKETIFIIHGWKNSYQSDVNSRIREFILRDHDINVFVVDWSPIAGRSYTTAQASVKQVGGFVADFAKSVSSSYGLNLSQLKFVGHSLGAHVCGNAGAALNGKVDRIVGLDPAGPYFKENNKDNRIDDSDAINVQIIHTNGGKLGYKAPCGDSDFYPNGGSSQPGCTLDATGACAHSRAYAFYAESLTSNKFVVQKCSSYKEYTSGKCTGPKSSMGMFKIDTGARGVYYLTTNKKSPYAKG